MENFKLTFTHNDCFIHHIVNGESKLLNPLCNIDSIDCFCEYIEDVLSLDLNQVTINIIDDLGRIIYSYVAIDTIQAIDHFNQLEIK